MTQAEIIAMATEAGFEWESLGLRDRFCFERFAALVAAKERESCALVCDRMAQDAADRTRPQQVLLPRLRQYLQPRRPPCHHVKK